LQVEDTGNSESAREGHLAGCLLRESCAAESPRKTKDFAPQGRCLGTRLNAPKRRCLVTRLNEQKKT